MTATVGLVIVAALAGGCSDDEAAAPTTASLAGVPVAPDVRPAAELSAFCRTMLELGRDDTEEVTLDEAIVSYEEIQAEVPSSIRPEFDVVLERLRLLRDGSDVPDVAQADEATLALASYVDLECRATTQSPLPPPTQPLTDDPEP